MARQRLDLEVAWIANRSAFNLPEARFLVSLVETSLGNPPQHFGATIARCRPIKLPTPRSLMTSHSTASKWNILSAMVFGILLVGSSSVSATSIKFDFEELALGGPTGLPTVTSTKSGLTLTVTREDDANIGIQDLNNPTTQVSDFGHRTLSNFLGSSNATVLDAMLVLSFSAPISSGSISFGDLGGSFPHDDDSPVVWTAFSGLNGTGLNLGSVSVGYPSDLGFLDQGNGAIRTLTIAAAGIRSLTISSGGTAPGTLYYDNIVVDTAAVPEPGTLSLLGLGSAYLIRRRRRNRR
jgi:hypothetical protein